MRDPRDTKGGEDEDVEQGMGYSMPPEEPAGPASGDPGDELEQGIGYSAPADATHASD